MAKKLAKQADKLTKHVQKVGSILVLAILVGFLAGLLYSNSGSELTGHATEVAPPIADLTVVDAFFVKESDYLRVVGSRPLAQVKPEELTPYRFTDSFLQAMVRPVVIVKNRGSESVSQRLRLSGSPYTTCDLAGVIMGVRDGKRYFTTYLNVNCADFAPEETRVFTGTVINKVARPGKYCIDAVIDTTDTLSEWDESNNAKHNVGCMDVPAIAHRYPNA